MLNTDEIRCFTLDFSECKSVMEVYAVIRTGLELPEWFGENLDALWDSLRGIMYVPAEITVKYRPRDPQLHKYIEEIIDTMREAEEEFRDITVKVET